MNRHVIHGLAQPHEDHDLGQLPDQGNSQHGEPEGPGVQPVSAREDEHHEPEEDDLSEEDGQGSRENREWVRVDHPLHDVKTAGQEDHRNDNAQQRSQSATSVTRDPERQHDDRSRGHHRGQGATKHGGERRPVRGPRSLRRRHVVYVMVLHAAWVILCASWCLPSLSRRQPPETVPASACERYHKRREGIHLGSQSVRTRADMETTTMTTIGAQPLTKAKDTTPRATGVVSFAFVSGWAPIVVIVVVSMSALVLTLWLPRWMPSRRL